jgi:hypothetical protein
MKLSRKSNLTSNYAPIEKESDGSPVYIKGGCSLLKAVCEDKFKVDKQSIYNLLRG